MREQVNEALLKFLGRVFTGNEVAQILPGVFLVCGISREALSPKDKSLPGLEELPLNEGEGLVTALEATERLGISWRQWEGMVTARLKGRDLPAPVKGRNYSKKALFVWNEVQAMKYRFRATTSKRKASKKPEGPSEKTVLDTPEKTSKKEDPKPKPIALPEPPMEQVWPEGLPKDYAELERQYGPYIKARIAHLNKTPATQEDLEQEIFLKLLDVQILEKFAAKVWKEHRVTAIEACEFLGVTWTQFTCMVTARKNGREDLPGPIGGPKDRCTGEIKTYSKQAVYRLEDIRRLDASGYFRRQPNPRIEPKLTCRGFKTYLGMAIANHFKNCCRSKFRRHKERCQADHEDGTSWESGLADDLSDISIEDMLAMKRALEEINDGNFVAIEDFDLGDQESRETYRGHMAQAEDRIKAATTFCSKGHTIRETVRRIPRQIRQRTDQRVAQVA